MISKDRIFDEKQKKIPNIDVKSGEKKSFSVGFMRRFGSGADEDSPDRLVSFSLPIQKGRDSLINFNANFKGISEQSGHFNPDLIDE